MRSPLYVALWRWRVTHEDRTRLKLRVRELEADVARLRGRTHEIATKGHRERAKLESTVRELAGVLHQAYVSADTRELQLAIRKALKQHDVDPET